MVEGTTRYVSITVVDEDNEAFDFTGFTVQTIMKLTGQDAIAKELLLPTAVVGNILRFTLPAEESVGMKSGVFETRYFKPDQSDVIEEVESVIIGRVTITKSPKPNVIPQEATP